MTTPQQYEDYIVEVLRRHLNLDSVCVDVGCHVGAVLREMEVFAPEGRHIAFEPIPDLYEDLVTNHRGSQVFRCALGNTSKTASFHYVKNDPAYSGLMQREYDIPNPDIELIDVEVRRLDELIKKSQDISLIKLDVEGGEYDAMQGAKSTIQRCRPILIFESSDRSTGYYGVEAVMLYKMVSEEFGLKVSTLSAWLDNRPALGLQEFLAIYNLEYYFVAYP